jgi:2-oxopent-4-enoate/cis-2-oxohex-4-enoate hydratase
MREAVRAAHLSQSAIEEHGNELYQALVGRAAVAPLTDRIEGFTIDDAYRIQQHLIARLLEAGESIVGKKVGATSKVVQTMLGVQQPDFGCLLTGMVYNEGEAIPANSLIQPRAEGEIAFILKRDLLGPGITHTQVLSATECVMPCFEICDSRIRDWRIKIQDTIADNASCGAFVLGGAAVNPRNVDLALCGMVLEKNGEIVGTGAGAAALGHPLNAVAWLANTLGNLGIALKAGEVILSGSLAQLIPVKAGDSLRIAVGGIGGCSVRFV